MAKMIENAVVIKVTKLVRDTDETVDIITADIIAALEQVTEELVGSGVLVEIEAA